METGAIALSEVDGSFDLQATVESGQSYLWDRTDGQMYESAVSHGGSHWYEAVVPPIASATGAWSGSRRLMRSRC